MPAADKAWQEIARELLPGSLRLWSGRCPGFCISWRIQERNATTDDYGSREVATRPLYLKDRSDLVELHSIALIAMGALEAAAKRAAACEALEYAVHLAGQPGERTEAERACITSLRDKYEQEAKYWDEYGRYKPKTGEPQQ